MFTRAKIGLFYGSSTCYTEIVAEKIQKKIGEDLVDLHNIVDEPIVTAQFYSNIIMGIPTWDYGELQEDWEEIWQDITELNLTDKKVALYGLGDQIGYPEWFLDAMGYLHTQLEPTGAQMIGYTSIESFTFENSKALDKTGQLFVGLALDEENEFDKTEARLEHWCQNILTHFNLSK